MRPPEAAPALVYKNDLGDVVIDNVPVDPVNLGSALLPVLNTDIELNGYKVKGELETDALIIDGGLLG